MVRRIVHNADELRDYWAFRLCASFGILSNATFRKLDLFLSIGHGVEDTSGSVNEVTSF
jgi:hypothetical protein